MTQEWDEFSKLLAEPMPRRESLRRLGALLGGAVLGPLAAGSARANGKRRAGNDPCKSFCRCSNKKLQRDCLAVCRACNGDTSRVCGACGSHSCADRGDPYNCGACGYVCPPPGLNEVVSCVAGQCVYECVNGTVRCDGVCTDLNWDRDNCGACGNVCGDLTLCVYGACRDCNCYGDGVCHDLFNEVNNCGACGVVCPDFYVCYGGVCHPGEVSPIPY